MLPVPFEIPEASCSDLQRGLHRFMSMEGFLPGQTLTELTVRLRQGDLCTASAPASALGAPSHQPFIILKPSFWIHCVVH